MSFFGSAWKAYQIAREARGAFGAAEDVLTGGGGPVRALRAAAGATEGQLDDAVVAEIEAGIRRILTGLHLVSVGCITLAEALADPRVRAALDRAIATAIDVGFMAGGCQAKLKAWMEET